MSRAAARPDVGRVIWAAGPVVRAVDLPAATVGELVRVGPNRLLGEVIHLDRQRATIQLYEESAGLMVGDTVEPTGGPLVAWLGPGLLGGTFDGLQRPLDRLAAAGGWLLGAGAGASAGAGMDALGGDRRWTFHATRPAGTSVGPGDVLGEVVEGSVQHRILVPPGTPGGRLATLRDGSYRVTETIGTIDAGDGAHVALRLAHPWPLRTPRPVERRLAIDRPLVTGTRVIDMLFPLARGGTAVIPGGFGTGKTVVEQSLARWSDADVVVYVGCGERGNEIAELLSTFPQLLDLGPAARSPPGPS